ncbi:MAG: hypothetical protein RL088_2706 [Verrucomicrobiota bacterium]|jgi:hypothetical protein
MKHIITLVAVAFTLSLGACCTTGSTCPMGGKKADTCCAKKADSCCAKKDGSCKHKH